MSNQQQPGPQQSDAQRGEHNDRPVQNPLLSSNRIPSYHQAIPTVTWDPRRHTANDLQRWSTQSLTPFLRLRFPVVDRNNGRVHANHDFDRDINSVIKWSEHIDAFDKYPNLMDELILYLTHPEQADSHLSNIVQDRNLVTILLYRHYQRHGGLILPPIAEARQAITEHARSIQDHPRVLETLRQQGVQKEELPLLPRVVFPNWTFRNNNPGAQVGLDTAATTFQPATPGRSGAAATAQVQSPPRGSPQGPPSTPRRSGGPPASTAQVQSPTRGSSSQGGRGQNPNPFGSNTNPNPFGGNKDRRDPGSGGAGFVGERKRSRYFGGSK